MIINFDESRIMTTGLAIDITIVFLGFAVFAFAHTLLANPTIKEKLFDKWPVLQSRYRIVYSLLAVIMLAVWYLFSPFPIGILYDIPSPYHFLFHGMQSIGVIGFILSLKAINLGEFLGLKRQKPGHPDVDHYEEPLVIDGIYKWVRHPLYISTIMILLFNPLMSYKLALITILIILYCWIGSIFEERNLVKLYGQKYLRYQSRVPRFIPKFPLF